MTKNEALKAAIDGKKVTFAKKSNVVYIYWDGMQFMSHDSFGSRPADFKLRAYENQDWQIVPEFVDFAEAWKAYDNGKRIRSVASECEWLKSTVGSAYHSFSTTEIRGKWLILEDE